MSGTSRPADEAILKDLELQGTHRSFDEMICVEQKYDKNKADQVTKYWIGIRDIDPRSRTMKVDGLDAGTAFEILSIDIADIDIGKNIGAALQIDQANADKNIAQAKAEERRAMAVASEQEMKAKAQEARAKVIEAEAEVPKAMAEAFRSGNLGIMDYLWMK